MPPDASEPRPSEVLDLPGALVVGAGPAGLAAAEVLAGAGHPVLLADAMPSPARKLLMAGKSGLNLTKEEARDAFHAAYGAGGYLLTACLATGRFAGASAASWLSGRGLRESHGEKGPSPGPLAFPSQPHSD